MEFIDKKDWVGVLHRVKTLWLRMKPVSSLIARMRLIERLFYIYIYIYTMAPNITKNTQARVIND